MIITLTRSGGFLGATFTKTIDTSTLPSKETQEIESLLANNELWSQKETGSKDNQLHRDTFTYTLSIQQAQNDLITNSITLHEHLLTPEIRKLLSKLEEM